MFSRTNTYAGTKELNKEMIKREKVNLPAAPTHGGWWRQGGRRKRRASRVGCRDCTALHPINFVRTTFR